jgi:hypothetical protein
MDFKSRVEAIMAPKLAALEDYFLEDVPRSSGTDIEPVLDAIRTLSRDMRRCCSDLSEKLSQYSGLIIQKASEPKRTQREKTQSFLDSLKSRAKNSAKNYWMEHLINPVNPITGRPLFTDDEVERIISEYVDFLGDELFDWLLPDGSEPILDRLPAIPGGESMLNRIPNVYLTGMRRIADSFGPNANLASLYACCSGMATAMSDLGSNIHDGFDRVDQGLTEIGTKVGQVSDDLVVVQEDTNHIKTHMPDIPSLELLFRRYS